MQECLCFVISLLHTHLHSLALSLYIYVLSTDYNIGELWRQLSPEQKKPYEDRAKALRESSSYSYQQQRHRNDSNDAKNLHPVQATILANTIAHDPTHIL